MTTVENTKRISALDKIIVVLCFCLLGVFPTTLSNGPNLIIKLTDQSGRPIAGAFVSLMSFGGPEPTVGYSEARTHWNGYSIFEPGVTFNGFWGEVMVTVNNRGGAGYVVVYGAYMTGLYEENKTARLYEENKTVYMDAGETLNATVFIPISNDHADYDLNWIYYCGFIPLFRGIAITGSDGLANFSLPAEVYTVTAGWFTRYNREPIIIINTTLTINSTNAPVTLLASIYDITLQLVTPSGKPISGATMSLAGVLLGMTDADGKVVAPQVPGMYNTTSAAYPVTAIWYGIDVSPAPITITASKTYVLTATPSPVTVATNVFIELFGQAMTFATFLLYIIVIIIVIAVFIREIMRRQRLKQPIKQDLNR